MIPNTSGARRAPGGWFGRGSWLLLAGAVLVLTPVTVGCGPRDRGLDLKDAVRAYNQRLRWNAYEQASQFVNPETRAAWLAARTASAGGLKITDIKVVRLQKPDPGERTVEVLVALSWYRLPETRVQRAVWAQTWQEKEARWRLIDEEVVEQGQQEAAAPPQQWP